jgi:hypothetical protein
VLSGKNYHGMQLLTSSKLHPEPELFRTEANRHSADDFIKQLRECSRWSVRDEITRLEIAEQCATSRTSPPQIRNVSKVEGTSASIQAAYDKIAANRRQRETVMREIADHMRSLEEPPPE